jgi:DNA-binding IclR family transcriptional regulator
VARSSSGESAFTPETPALMVSEVARRAGLPVATASRLVAELVDHGLLARDTDRRVRVGTRLWELGLRASPTLSLREKAMPVMEELQRSVGHHTQLGVLDGEEVLFVERLSAEQAVINFTRIAARLPLHASSSGLVLLSYGSSVLQERVLERPRHRYTPATVTEAGALRSLLADVRKQGFALCPGHIHPDATGIAVPIRNVDRQVVAAVSVIVPNDARARSHVFTLTAAARQIGERLAES